ncbi:hypothetical protein NQZ68_011889 [Dissostichus eleginoides]|nr:hypothetical protein NQZ68_011889 [Dissostichus eleginoides]
MGEEESAASLRHSWRHAFTQSPSCWGRGGTAGVCVGGGEVSLQQDITSVADEKLT